MPVSADTISDLKEKRSELKMQQETLKQQIQDVEERLEAVDKTIQLLEPDIPSTEEGSEKRLPDWPSGESMPKRVSYVLEEVERVMQPREVDEYVRANSSDDIRDNAVAETLSRLARQDKLARKDYGKSSFYYGQKNWWDEEKGDFVESVKPDQWALPNQED